jgi:hypothetical protein
VSEANSSTGRFDFPLDVWQLFDHPSRRDQLRANLLLKQYQLEVDLRHVGLYNDELAHAIQDRPADILPLVSTISLSLDSKLRTWSV